METYRIPETVPDPTWADKIVDLAIELVDLDSSGSSRNESYNSALFYVPDNDVSDGKYASLKINVPREEVADQYQWRAELTFGNQDPKLSSHILVGIDGQVRYTNYEKNRGEDLIMTESQAESLYDYLDSIRDNLITDPQ